MPARRHFWAARLIQTKSANNELKSQKIRILKQVTAKLADEAPIRMENRNLVRAAEQSEDIIKINEQIAENDLIIELLEHVQKNFNSATYDIKNVIDLMKMEQ